MPHLSHQLALMIILNIGATSGENLLPSSPQRLDFVSHQCRLRTRGLAQELRNIFNS
jgi:hypothetical protein